MTSTALSTSTTTKTEDHPPLPSALLPFTLHPRSDVAYVPEFVTQKEEEALLRQLRPPSSPSTDAAGTSTAAATASAPRPQAGWRVVSGRRVLVLGGAVQGGALTAAPLPSFVAPLLERLRETGAFRDEGATDDGDEKTSRPPPNHVLVNCYSPGEGIMPHEDGPLYHPCAAIVSLGSWAVLRFYSKRAGDEGEDDGRRRRDGESGARFSVALAPRSLVVFSGEAYRGMLHGIEAVEEEALDSSVLNHVDGEGGGGGGGRERRRTRDEQVALAAAPSSLGGYVIPRGIEGLGSTSEERVSLTVRRVLRVRKNLLARLGPRA